MNAASKVGDITRLYSIGCYAHSWFYQPVGVSRFSTAFDIITDLKPIQAETGHVKGSFKR